MRAKMVAAALLAGLLVATGAFADGGSSIANAPELPIGQQVQGGTTDGCKNEEFWRLTLLRGDHVRLDYGSLNGETIVLAIYAPSTTDYTFDGDSPIGSLASSGTSRKAELRYIAPAPGRYVLLFRTAECGGVAMAYEMTGYVRHLTHATLGGPTVARAHSRIKLHGTVKGLASGKVVTQSLVHRRWKTISLVSVAANGSFAFTARVGAPGVQRFRAVFYGDPTHLPTRAPYSVRVV
jgi:hypothetical protein